MLLSMYLAVLDDQSKEEQFIDSSTGAKTMHALSPVQLRHPTFKDLFPVLARAQLLLCFGFFVAEIGKVGFGLGQWHHAPFSENKKPNNQTCFATDCLARKSVYGFGS